MLANKIVSFQSLASGKNIRVTADGTVSATGGAGPYARFRVHKVPGIRNFTFESVGFPGQYLRTGPGGNTNGKGKGGNQCHYNVTRGQQVVIKSNVTNRNIGFLPTGEVKNTNNVGNGPHAQFRVIVHGDNIRVGGHPTAPPAVQVGRAIASAIVNNNTNSNVNPRFAPNNTSRPGGNLLSHGKVIGLRAKSTGRYVRIDRQTNQLEALGGNGNLARWRVHRDGNKNIKFESVAFPGQYLRTGPAGNTNANGKGGNQCNYIITQRFPHIFTSTIANGNLGFRPDGQAANVKNTGYGPKVQFEITSYDA